MDFHYKKIGIWGFGISGQATVGYLLDKACQISILEKNKPKNLRKFLSKKSKLELLEDNKINRQKFLEESDIVIISPGIDVRNHEKFKEKFLSDIDIFSYAWKKPIVAITGTLGKTSVTHILSNLLKNIGINNAIGGNIGVGVLDLVNNQSKSKLAILELSSFQLEHCKRFAPDCAVWTNFYPNHLDRHGTIESYFNAKKNFLLRQNNSQHSLVPIEILEQIRKDPVLKQKKFSILSNSHEKVTKEKSIIKGDMIYSLDKEKNILKNSEVILSKDEIPKISYKKNWLIIAAVLDSLKLEVRSTIQESKNLSLPGNRLELIRTIHGVKFYNDSKSTIMQSTIAAVDEIKNGNIILLLGGTNKGVDRSNQIKKLINKIKKIICFGSEAVELRNSCLNFGIDSDAHDSMESAFESAHKNSNPGCSILFSPGGASFDLFKNYEERGKCFKKLVLNLE